MIIACSTTTRLPSETANSIQAIMACDGLRRAGAEVHLFVPGEGEISFDRVREQYSLHCDPFPIRYVASHPRLHRMDFTLSVLSAAKKIRADVHYTWTIQLAAAAALLGLETAYEIHDLPVGGGIRWFDLYTRAKAHKKIICITKALRDRLLAQFPHLQQEDCLIMPNGFSPEDYSDLPGLEAAKQQMGFSLDRPAVSCSGHLYQGRGSKLFLQLAERFPMADFHWFGGTSDAVKSCQTEAEAAGLMNVTFHGYVPRSRLPLAQAACDVLLMPYDRQIAGSGGGNSAEICSPMKMFEYMAVGRCILSSDLPVISEVLDKTDAVFCEPEDVESWTNNLQTVLENADLRGQYAKAVKIRSEQYTWQKRAEIYLNGRKHA